MTTIALIPARGGSKGIYRKNIKKFLSKPLIYWSIKLAIESHLIDRVIVSTEDKEIAKIAQEYSAEVPFLRPKEYSQDNSKGIYPVLNALENIRNISDVLLMQPTSPLRRHKDIEEIFRVRTESNSESAVSVTQAVKPLNIYFDMNKKNKISPVMKKLDIEPRQSYSDRYILNGSLYLSSKNSILKYKSLLTPETVGYVMPAEYSIDIDTPLDWEIAEFLMKKKL